MRHAWLASSLLFALGCPGLSVGPSPQDMNTSPPDMSSDVAPDLTPDASLDMTEDAAPDMAEARAVGAPCDSDAVCGEGFCAMTTFPDGYCTQECAEDTPGACPAGSACINLTDKGTCFQECSVNEDCREGYECFGDTWCFPALNMPEVPVGEPCTEDTMCGDGFCDTELPGGYCTVACDLNTVCPEDSACFDVGDDTSACFKECERDSECREGYICDVDNTCFLEPQAEDLFESLTLHAPCGSQLWGAWTSTEAFSIAEVELRNLEGTPLLSRTFDPARDVAAGAPARVLFFENEALNPTLMYELQLKISESGTASFVSGILETLPPGTQTFEVRTSQVTGAGLSVTLRPGVDGTLARATLYDTNGCQLDAVMPGLALTNGASALVEFQGSFQPATPYHVIVEGDGFIDTLSFTTP